ncbi:MAG: beta-propeller domain-containing protein [Rhizomicrobium sp.]|jgi:hypothetical protein
MALYANRLAGCALSALFLGIFTSPIGASPPDFRRSASDSHALVSFKSDEDLRQFLMHRFAARRRVVGALAVPAPPPPNAAMAGSADTVSETAVSQGQSNPGITNTQEAGVDEGDIVKMRGDTMVILRRGRLFTVSLARGGMRPVDSINAYAPGVDARDDWYDEMLIAGDRIVVIGYSYRRGGTELNRFHLSADGRLAYEDTYQLRSNDYYSSRNYASRLIGNRLIFYSPLYLRWGAGDPLDALPALRRWTGDPNGGFRRIAGGQDVYVPAALRDAPDMETDALHTVTTCDLAAPILDCSAVSVLGPESRTFYLSAHAVYVWVTSSRSQDFSHVPSSLVYRLPLDGARPSAVGARGAPADQFSFREDPADGTLDVLVRSEGAGDAMWHSEFSRGAVALLRIPAQSFGNGDDEVSDWNYIPLPKPRGNAYDFHNRFVGDYVLYGAGNGWSTPHDHDAEIVAVNVRGGGVTELPLDRGVDRIEAMGRDAVVVGSDSSSVTFTAVELTAGRAPVIGDRYALEASQAETRSHAFFFLPDQDAIQADNGVLGLPVARPARPAYRQLVENSAAMIFLRRSKRQFAPLGELDAQSDGIVDDDCVASCVDWYGNARPIFTHGRAFALMGYELIEGNLGVARIREIGRVNFVPAPRRQEEPRRPS